MIRFHVLQGLFIFILFSIRSALLFPSRKYQRNQIYLILKYQMSRQCKVISQEYPRLPISLPSAYKTARAEAIITETKLWLHGPAAPGSRLFRQFFLLKEARSVPRALFNHGGRAIGREHTLRGDTTRHDAFIKRERERERPFADSRGNMAVGKFLPPRGIAFFRR